jgi:hypothetical protein
VCVLAHDNNSTPLSRTSLRDFVAAARNHRSTAALHVGVAADIIVTTATAVISAVDDPAVGTPKTGLARVIKACSGGGGVATACRALSPPGLWCVEAPPPWRSVLHSAGVDGTQPGKRVRLPPQPPLPLPSLPGQGPVLCKRPTPVSAWPPYWEAQSVTLVLVRRWSPVVELVRAWWAAAPVKDLATAAASRAPTWEGPRARGRTGVEQHRHAILIRQAAHIN